jgi:hypothetical protein
VLFPVTAEEAGEAVMEFGYGYAKWRLTVGPATKSQLLPVWAGSQPAGTAEPGLYAAITNCEGWGYACCNPLTQVGDGEAVADGIMSCPDSCYQRCRNRPAILSFASGPPADVKTRTVTVKQDSLVVFSYGVQDIDSSGVTVTIDYGDGQMAESTNQTDEFSHVYGCSGSQCRYQAELLAHDSEGLENSQTRINVITVIVN